MNKRFVLSLALLCILLFSVGSAEIRVLIAYDSPNGHTAQVAEWIAEGVRAFPDTELRFQHVSKTSHDDLVWADAIIVGSPVYNTGLTPQAGTFLAEWPFDGAPLKNRVGAAFTSSQGATAGAENCMFQILKTMLMFRMIAVGGEEWRAGFGVAYVRDGSSERTLEYVRSQAQNLGQRVCRTALATEQLRESRP